MTSSIREKRIAVEKEKKIARRAEENAPVMVRARDDKGHFVKDDPTTPENEAWVEAKKVAAKPAAKKKAAPKKAAAKKSRAKKV